MSILGSQMDLLIHVVVVLVMFSLGAIVILLFFKGAGNTSRIKSNSESQHNNSNMKDGFDKEDALNFSKFDKFEDDTVIEEYKK